MWSLEFEIEQPRQERSRSTFPRKIGLAVLFAVVVVCVCFACKALEWKMKNEGSLDFFFGRPEIVDDDDKDSAGTVVECEGQWPYGDACFVEPIAAGCPQLRVKADWPDSDKEVFLKKLLAMEDAARQFDNLDQPNDPQRHLNKHKCQQFEGSAPIIRMEYYKEPEWSRMVQWEFTGGHGEFRSSNVRWHASFSEYYVQKYNVAPTDAFRRFVDEFDLDAFIGSIEACKNQVPHKIELAVLFAVVLVCVFFACKACKNQVGDDTSPSV